MSRYLVGKLFVVLFFFLTNALAADREVGTHPGAAQQYEDLLWPASFGEQKPIGIAHRNFTQNLELIYMKYLDAETIAERIVCIDRSWWQLKTMWDVETKRPQGPQSLEDLELMKELARRISLFSDFLLRFFTENPWPSNKNEDLKKVVQDLVITIGYSSLSTEKAKDSALYLFRNYEIGARKIENGQFFHWEIKPFFFGANMSNRLLVLKIPDLFN